MAIASALLTKTLRSKTFKLALASIAAFGAIVVVFLGYIYISTATYVQSDFDRALIMDRSVMDSAFRRAGRAGVIAEIQRQLSDSSAAGSVFLLTDSSHNRLAGNLKAWPAKLRRPGAPPQTIEEWKDAEKGLPVRASMSTLPNGDRLLLGRTLDQIDTFRSQILNALIAALALISFLAAGASIAVTRRTISRIESISATSRGVMQNDFKKRIPLKGSHDEWDQVAGNLNAMLDCIERLMEELKQATDNVAHDLRTPLTRIRGRLERAHNQPDHRDGHQELIGDTIAELDVVLRMFSSLTRISQIEANLQKSAFRAVSLFEVAGKAAELYEAAAEEKGIRLQLIGDGTLSVIGDPDLIFDALSNLLDNAIKHGRADSEVTIEIGKTANQHVVCVADKGPGIPAREHADVLKRFYRLERSRHTSGNGLGLSLVAAVAHIHGARIEMLDNAPGLRAQLIFPASLAASSDETHPDLNGVSS